MIPAETLRAWGLEPQTKPKSAKTGAVLGLILGILLDPLVRVGPIAAYFGIILAVAGLINFVVFSRKRNDILAPPFVWISIAASFTIYAVFCVSWLFFNSGGVLASVASWVGIGPYVGSLFALWPVPVTGGLLAMAFVLGQRHATRAMCLARFPLYVLIPLVPLGLYLAPPPTLERVASSYGRINTDNGTQVVDLVRQQKQVQLLTEYLPLFPTGSRYIYMAAAGDNFWQIDSALQAKLAEQFEPRIRTPLWKRFQGSLGIVAFILLLAAASYLRRLDRDRLDWAKAVAHNSFAGFRSFMKTTLPERTNYFLSLGAKELMKRKREFALYLQILTYWNREAPLRNWLIETVREARSRDGVRLAVEFRGTYDRGTFRDAIMAELREHERHSPRDDTSSEIVLEAIEELKRQLTYKNVHQIDQYVNKEMLDELENVVTKILEGVFGATLGERIVAFCQPTEAHDSRLHINYKIAQTTNLFSIVGSTIPEMDRTWYRGVQFRWSVDASGKAAPSASTELETDPSGFRADTSSPRSVFIPMAITTFVRFGADLMVSMGFPRAEGILTQSEDEIVFLIKQLMEKIRSESREQLTDQFIHDFVIDHEEEIRAITAYVASKLDGFVGTMLEKGLEAALNEILGQGVAGAIELF